MQASAEAAAPQAGAWEFYPANCAKCGAPGAICDREGNAGDELCPECAKPKPARCENCGRMAEPVWLGPWNPDQMRRLGLKSRWVVSVNPCPHCVEEFGAREMAPFQPRSKRPPSLARADLPPEAEGWDFLSAPKRAAKLLSGETLSAWREGFERARLWTGMGKGPYLHGPARRGKTMALYCLVRDAVESRRVPALFVSATELCRMAAESFAVESKARAMVERAKVTGFLALDDLGAVRLSRASQRDALYEILDHRKKQALPMAVSSNYDYGGLDARIPKDFGRVIGRVVASTFPVVFGGPNLEAIQARKEGRI